LNERAGNACSPKRRGRREKGVTGGIQGVSRKRLSTTEGEGRKEEEKESTGDEEKGF